MSIDNLLNVLAVLPIVVTPMWIAWQYISEQRKAARRKALIRRIQGGN